MASITAASLRPRRDNKLARNQALASDGRPSVENIHEFIQRYPSTLKSCQTILAIIKENPTSLRNPKSSALIQDFLASINVLSKEPFLRPHIIATFYPSRDTAPEIRRINVASLLIDIVCDNYSQSAACARYFPEYFLSSSDFVGSHNFSLELHTQNFIGAVSLGHSGTVDAIYEEFFGPSDRPWLEPKGFKKRAAKIGAILKNTNSQPADILRSLRQTYGLLEFQHKSCQWAVRVTETSPTGTGFVPGRVGASRTRDNQSRSFEKDRLGALPALEATSKHPSAAETMIALSMQGQKENAEPGKHKRPKLYNERQEDAEKVSFDSQAVLATAKAKVAPTSANDEDNESRGSSVSLIASLPSAHQETKEAMLASETVEPKTGLFSDLKLVADSARASKSSYARQVRVPWDERETLALERGVEKYACRWALIESKAREGEFSELKGRGQVALKDKARNLKFAYLKAGVKNLPKNFEYVTLSASQKLKLRELGIETRHYLENGPIGSTLHGEDMEEEEDYFS